VEFKILGTPFTKQSFKFRATSNLKGNVFITKYQNKKITDRENNVSAQVAMQLPEGFVPFSGPVRINSIKFIFPPLKGFSKKKLTYLMGGGKIYKTTTPDLGDNLMKGLLDAMNGIVYLDDKQICIIRQTEKYFGLTPMTVIDLEEISENG